MKSRVISFGSLASPLAKSQTQFVISRLQAIRPRQTCQMTIVPTPVADSAKADEPFLAAAAAEVEFLEEQLLAEEFQVVVVAAPDLVLPLREGVTYAAVPERSTPYDAFLNRQGLIIDEMTAGSVIGVPNLRTRIQMQSLWPDLEFPILTGGLDRGLESLLRQCQVDGLVLPAGAAEHLGIQGIVSEIFYPEMILPSSGQGTLVALGRQDDQDLRDLLQPLHSLQTFQEMTAEHAFMQHFASDLDLPISVLAQVKQEQIHLTGATGSAHGVSTKSVTLSGDSEQAEMLGSELARLLLQDGQTVIDLLEADFPDGLPAGDLESDFEEEPEDELGDDLRAELADLDIIPPPPRKKD